MDFTQAQQITAQLNVVTDIPPTLDVLFVFGTMLRTPAHIAANYISRGVANYVVLTGGVNRVTQYNEAEAHGQILLSLGIGEDRIILENRSANTLENVVYGISELAKRVALPSIASMGVVAKWYHCRRAMMTLKRHFPSAVRYYALTYEPEGTTRTNWWQTSEGMRRVVKEWESIPRYLAKGDIASICESNGAYM